MPNLILYANDAIANNHHQICKHESYKVQWINYDDEAMIRVVYFHWPNVDKIFNGYVWTCGLSSCYEIGLLSQASSYNAEIWVIMMTWYITILLLTNEWSMGENYSNRVMTIYTWTVEETWLTWMLIKCVVTKFKETTINLCVLNAWLMTVYELLISSQ